MFRLLLSLLFLPAVVDACGLSLVNESEIPEEATVEYSDRLFRGPYNGTQLPPWVPLKVFPVYHPDVKKLSEKTQRDLSNFLAQALNRLGKMVKVRKTEKIYAYPCKGRSGFTMQKVSGDYNFVLYIEVKKMAKGTTLASCAPCSAEALVVDKSSRKVYHEYEKEYAKFNNNKNRRWGRPISGSMTVNKDQFEWAKKVNRQEKWIGIIMHEISHALGFSSSLFPRYINCNQKTGKCQLYPGQQINFNKPSGRIYEIPGIVKKVNRKWLLRSREKNHSVYVMALPAVKKVAAEYFNCPEIDGVEMENQGLQGTVFSHLEMRVYEQENMRGLESEINAYSAITLSFFEASGFYKVDYKHADPMNYGKGKGCDFAMKSCGHFKSYPFCFDESYTCNEDRTAIKMCNAFWYQGEIPPEYDYYERPKNIVRKKDYGSGRSLVLTDFCPYYNIYHKKGTNGEKSDSKCSSPIVNDETSASLQIFSKKARCFELKKMTANSPITVKKTKNGKSETYAISHGCYEHKCEKGKVWIKAAKGKFHQCQKDGQLISVEQPGPIAGEVVAFQIQCPDCNILCGKKCTRRKPSRPTEKPCRPNDKSSGLSDDPCPSTEEPEQTEETSRPADEPRTTTRDDWPRAGNGYGVDHHVAIIAILALLFLCLYLCLSRKRASK